MVVTQTQTGDALESYVLSDGDARVMIAPARGALVTRFAIGDDELLYLDEATLRDTSKNVRGGVPVLFPFAGKLTDGAYTTRDGARYAMPQHGFGRNRAWRVEPREASGEAPLVLVLEDDAATRAVYPFSFRAELALLLMGGAALSMRLSIQNRGTEPLPFAPGWHPYFRIAEGEKRATRIGTDATRARDNRSGQGDAVVAVDAGIDLAADEVDLHLLDHRADEAVLMRPHARPIAVRFTPGVLVVWTLRGKDFVCVEPWAAPADAFNTDASIWVAPGERAEFGAVIERR